MKSKKNEELNFLYLDDKYNKKKTSSKKAQKKPTKKKSKQKEQNDELFNFDNEIVIGVTKMPKQEVKSKTKKASQKKASKKNNKEKNASKKTTKIKEKKGADKKSAPNRTKKQVSKKQVNKIKEVKNNKNRFIKNVIKWLVLLCALIAAIIFFMMSPLFNVSEIGVTGNNSINEETIISLSEIQVGENIYKTSSSKIMKRVKQNAYVESVQIKRHLPNKIELIIKERKATYMIEYAGSYAYINNQGYILEISNQALELPIIVGCTTKQDSIGPGNRLEQEDLNRLEMVLKIMDSAQTKELDTQITKIDISDKQNYTIHMDEEKKIIYIGDASNLSSRMEYVKKVLEDTKGLEGEIFVNRDLSIKEKAFFRPKQ